MLDCSCLDIVKGVVNNLHHQITSRVEERILQMDIHIRVRCRWHNSKHRVIHNLHCRRSVRLIVNTGDRIIHVGHSNLETLSGSQHTHGRYYKPEISNIPRSIPQSGHRDAVVYKLRLVVGIDWEREDTIVGRGT